MSTQDRANETASVAMNDLGIERRDTISTTGMPHDQGIITRSQQADIEKRRQTEGAKLASFKNPEHAEGLAKWKNSTIVADANAMMLDNMNDGQTHRVNLAERVTRPVQTSRSQNTIQERMAALREASSNRPGGRRGNARAASSLGASTRGGSRAAPARGRNRDGAPRPERASRGENKENEPPRASRPRRFMDRARLAARPEALLARISTIVGGHSHIQEAVSHTETQSIAQVDTTDEINAPTNDPVHGLSGALQNLHISTDHEQDFEMADVHAVNELITLADIDGAMSGDIIENSGMMQALAGMSIDDEDVHDEDDSDSVLWRNATAAATEAKPRYDENGLMVMKDLGRDSEKFLFGSIRRRESQFTQGLDLEASKWSQ